MGVPSSSSGALRITAGSPSSVRATISNSACGARPSNSERRAISAAVGIDPMLPVAPGAGKPLCYGPEVAAAVGPEAVVVGAGTALVVVVVTGTVVGGTGTTVNSFSPSDAML